MNKKIEATDWPMAIPYFLFETFDFASLWVFIGPLSEIYPNLTASNN